MFHRQAKSFCISRGYDGSMALRPTDEGFFQSLSEVFHFFASSARVRRKSFPDLIATASYRLARLLHHKRRDIGQ